MKQSSNITYIDKYNPYYPLVAIAIMIMLMCTDHHAQADSIMAPNASHAEYNAIPFAPLFGAGRYQQIYTSSIFASPVSIESLAFSMGSGAVCTSSVTIRLGTTTAQIGALSLALDDNVTSSLTTVFSNDNYSLVVTGTVFSSRAYTGAVFSGTSEEALRTQIGFTPFDSDNDGLPDDWELANGLNPNDDGSINSGNGVAGDPDNDGFSNIEEYIANTHPTNGSLFFNIAEVVNLPSPEVFFKSSTDRIYTLEYTDHLMSNIWVEVPGETVQGSGLTNSLVDNVVTNMRSYRVQVSLPVLPP
ncbi:MAG: hypothetical protein GKR87_13755 [Kiritimatiellae bacterium]|nr:hypothetical protein [Kiritimatiellia bacterium]